MSKEVFIVDGIRTPIGNFGGTLGPIRTDDLGALVIKELMNRNSNIDPMLIEDVIFGCANQAGEDNRNVARMCGLLAGLPWQVGGETVNRLCASGMSSTINASRAIKDGAGDIYISGGVENMTRGPWVISKVSKPFGRDAQMHDSSFGWRFVNPKMEELYGTDGMGVTAENLVEKYGIDRESQDQFSMWSQQKATAAIKSGRFAEEIMAVSIPQRKKDSIIFDTDEFIRSNTTMETLGGLRPAFRKDGSVTAGNASGLNDGAAAVSLMSGKTARELSIEPLAKIVSWAVCGVDPSIMGTGPIPASRLALKKAGWGEDELDLIEANEAFAAQAIAVNKEMGWTTDKVNVNGGAIAIGHPIGASGARILVSLVHEMIKTHSKRGLATLCIGGGMGIAMCIERNFIDHK